MAENLQRYSKHYRRAHWQEAQDAPDEYLLSVVTVNLNDAPVLEATLESLRGLKNEGDVELKFIDGGSVDDSLLLAKGFYRSEDVISEPDTGIYDAMNKGLFVSRGKYMLWLNSGDELLTSFSLSRIRAALENTCAEMHSFNVLYCDRLSGRVLREFLGGGHKLPHHRLPHGGTLFLRKAAMQLNGYDESYPVVADRDLMVRMHLAGANVLSYDFPISKFFNDGISSRVDLLLEDWRVDVSNGLISWPTYLKRVLHRRLAVYKAKMLDQFRGRTR